MPQQTSPNTPTHAHEQITDASTSALRKYQRIVVGSSSLWFTIKFELVSFLGNVLPGALGLWARQRLYRLIFKGIGRGTVFGANVILRHPNKITLGDNVVISDGCTLDARGDDNLGIDIGDNVIVGERTMLRCKNGNITVGDRVGIGANAGLYAVHGNHLHVGHDVMIGPYVYLGGTHYHNDQVNIPIREQGIHALGGIRIGDMSYIGAHTTIVDGVNIGHACIIGAGAVVRNDVPDCMTATPHQRLVLVARQAAEESVRPNTDSRSRTTSSPSPAPERPRTHEHDH